MRKYRSSLNRKANRESKQSKALTLLAFSYLTVWRQKGTQASSNHLL